MLSHSTVVSPTVNSILLMVFTKFTAVLVCDARLAHFPLYVLKTILNDNVVLLINAIEYLSALELPCDFQS